MIGEYDLVKGLSAFLRSVGIDVKYKLCSHSLKSIVEPELDIQYISVEKEKIDILKKMQKTLVLADDVSHRLCQCYGRACSHDSRWLGIHLFGNSQRVRTDAADSYRFRYIDR